ncbi:MAG: hypothetical protein ACRD0H_13430 [Actinomycetes bacterium]
MDWYVDQTSDQSLRHAGTVYGQRVATQCARSFPAVTATRQELGDCEIPLDACTHCAVHVNQMAGRQAARRYSHTAPAKRAPTDAVTRAEVLAVIAAVALVVLVAVAVLAVIP